MADELKNKTAVVTGNCNGDLRMNCRTKNEGLKVLENGRTMCSCRWKKCKRHGCCKECMEYHSRHIKYPLPYCKQNKPKKEHANENKD